MVGRKNIKLYWYEMPGLKNFGDELSPYIISKLFDVKISKHDERTLMNYVVFNIYRAYNFLIKINNIFSNNKKALKIYTPKIYLAVGSIICRAKTNSVIWGSGIIQKDDKIEGGIFHAVRGYKTIERLKELGLNAPSVVGDPALLLPLVYNPEIKKKHKIGIIPHYVDYKFITDNLQDKDILIIDLTEPNVEITIDRILSCECVISSSLHGIIVSHAYNIPALWYKISDNLFGDDVKFYDYFSSVKINEYNPFQTCFLTFNTMKIIDIITENNSINKLNINLKELQSNLLKASPFKIK